MSVQSDVEAFTVDECCRDLKIGKTNFYKLVKQGRIKTVKVFGRTLVLRTERDRFVASLDQEYSSTGR